MLFDGQTIKVDTHDGGLAELRFERGSEALNKLDALASGAPGPRRSGLLDRR